MGHFLKGCGMLCLLFLLHSCRTATQITGHWKNPQRDRYGYKNVVVTALTDNVQARAMVETDLADQLSSSGIAVSSGMEVFPPEFASTRPTQEEMLQEIRKTEADAILTVALIDQETESRFVPGSYGYAPFPRFSYYGRFWGYYSHLQPRAYAPGYYTPDKTYFIETNLYDATTEQLIWSAQSETYSPSDLAEFSEEFSRVIVQKLKQENIL